MQSFLDVQNGLYNPSLRFAFTNITTEDFVSYFNGSPITVKPGQTIELNHYMAVKLTKELVDKIMIGNAKMDEVAKNQPYYRSPMGGSLGIPAARKVFEDQILRQLKVDEESPEIQVLRAQIKAELQADMSAEKSNEPVKAPASLEEFSELNQQGKSEPAPEKKPLKVKSIKVK